MTSKQVGHADGPLPSTFWPSSKGQVYRSQSREAITIHFSALGKEKEEEEEELYGKNVSSSTSTPSPENITGGVVTALEASEELLFEGGMDSATNAAVLPVSSTTLPNVCDQQDSNPSPYDPTSSVRSSSPSSACAAAAPATSSTSNKNSPTKSVSLPTGDKSFLSLMKSLTTDVEAREGLPAPPALRHRQLMKNLVKSLSSDSSQDSLGSYRLPDSLQLFKQFTQPRTTAVADSKTAPSSPLTSPDSRSFSHKVSEVEARIEDTKRRLSEVMSDPKQLFSKIIGDESSGGYYKPKALSSSASELSTYTFLNDHPERNNNYSIKEEEGDLELQCLTSPVTDGFKPFNSLPLEKCSMSELAKQEDEEFCELYSDDFDLSTNTDTEGNHTANARTGTIAGQLASNSIDSCSNNEMENEELISNIPLKTLFALTIIVYGYFVLPLPTYVGGVLFGVALGFMLAIGVVWLAGPMQRRGANQQPRPGLLCNVVPLDIKEPAIFKGWMNEISNYNPETYHATLTHSVFVRMEGSTLRLSKPNRNIPRRASFNESKPDVTYISQKMYDLTDSKVYLVPQGLARKRVWNKKYPICIELAKQDNFMSKAEDDEAEDSEDKPLIERPEVTVAAINTKKPTASAQDVGKTSTSKEHQTLFLFGRTGREKEEWYRRVLLASKLKSESAKKTSGLSTSKSAPVLSHSRSSSRSSLDELLSSQPKQKESLSSAKPKPQMDYNVYMTSYVTEQTGNSPTTSPLQSPRGSPGASKKLPSSPVKEADPISWVNALVGRIAWDFLREKCWSDWVSKKIQMKLSKIRLPYFMNELTLTELDMGATTPRVSQASKPSVDHQEIVLTNVVAKRPGSRRGSFYLSHNGMGKRLNAGAVPDGYLLGLWIDLEVAYKGSFLMTLETKMNLARLGKEADGFGELGKEGHRPRAYCLADSDEESSSAGSSDEEDPPETAPENLPPGAEGYIGVHKPSKIMRFVDKLTKNKYFQKATETEFIKKKMEEVSNTPLLLTVEVQECRGTLAVNIPPPPTDRIWYGFRNPPHLELKARPKLGEREVTLAHVTDWIEKKLYQEFQKILVMPNMDDMWLLIMHSAMDPRSATPLNDAKKEPNSGDSTSDE